MSVRVLIADDQALVRMGIRALLTSEPDCEVVGETEEGEQAVELAAKLLPDVVLMDIRMPRLDGLAALRRIVADPRCGDVRVVVLTTFELDEYVFAALEAGAAGFLIKDAEPDEIIRAVRAAHDGGSLLSPSVTTRVIGTFARPGGTARVESRHPRLDDLTEREREVLALIAEGLNNDELAARLVISKATARTHVGNILSKLGARDRAQLVVIAYRSGIV